MDELQDLLERRAEWQRSRRLLPWSKKLELALTLREAALALRKSPPARERRSR